MLTDRQHKELTLKLQEVIGEALQAVGALPAPQCPTCINFNGVTEQCQLPIPAQRPPAYVIANGCEAYQNDDIPF